MTQPDAPFTPIERRDGDLPIEDHGLIGDGATVALVGRDGGIGWLCVPRVDAPPLFAGLLDRERGGWLDVAVEGLRGARQRYLGDSAVLVTELRGPEGVLRITDLMPLRAGADLREDGPADRRELLRMLRVTHGRVRVRVGVSPRGGARAEPTHHGRLRLRCDARPELDLRLGSDLGLTGLQTTLELAEGEGGHLLLGWGAPPSSRTSADPEAILAATLEAWRRWAGHIRPPAIRAQAVRRSAITLKLLDNFATGAMVAAATSSLPEAIGGPRNWDYRYAWVRDAAYSVYAMRRVGLVREASGFLGWVLRSTEQGERPSVLYDVDGRPPPPERVDPGLRGYRRSAPVRFGNAAARQIQHDVYGEMLDCAFQWAGEARGVGPARWARLVRWVEDAAAAWRRPDQGIWEVRSAARPFTYSAAMCQVALDRGARMAERHGLPGDAPRWRREATRIANAILEEAWSPELGSLTEHLGGGALDASLLALPLRRVVPADHPRMVATTAALTERLGAGGGLMYRYLPDESPDGLEGHEGAFLLCSFWLVDNLAGQGRRDEAMALFESLCGRASPLGLLPEQIDPGSGRFLGNFPQAFSHVGLISSAINLSRLTAG